MHGKRELEPRHKLIMLICVLAVPFAPIEYLTVLRALTGRAGQPTASPRPHPQEKSQTNYMHVSVHVYVYIVAVPKGVDRIRTN